MDIIVTHPFLHQRGGGERVVLEIAKKFNPTIYSIVYEPDKTYSEFKEFDIKILPKSLLEKPFFFMKGDSRRSDAVSAGFRYYLTKIKDDYDLINAQGVPSEWIRNKNERVSWYCHSPNREAFDLYKFRMRDLSFPRKILNVGLLSTFKFAEYGVVPKIEQILTNSEITNKRIKKYLHRSDARIIHPGVDVELFTNGSYDNYFFYPSRIVPEKRFEYVIEAFKLFSKKHKNWKLVLAGFTPKREREQKYLEKLKKLCYGLNVEFRVDIDDKEMKKLYANCYAVLFSAINEDWGLIPLEAMSAEKPCISVNEGGPTYSIVNGETGFLVNSEKEMADKMIYLASNSDENEKMGKAGRKRVLKNYTWKIFLDKIEKEFKKVVKS
ncbi:MAG: glycosyltransferase family 4 protein [Candidatus Micrarchaeota archaeon]